MTEQLISAEDAAAILGVAEQTLRGWRFENRIDQPAYVRVGRLVRYRPSVLQQWILDREYSPKETASTQ
jgi:predicted DNA-binding transcriptional regulator AlpA